MTKLMKIRRITLLWNLLKLKVMMERVTLKMKTLPWSLEDLAGFSTSQVWEKDLKTSKMR